MTRKSRRLWLVLACATGLGSATALTLHAFSRNLVFFVGPTELAHDRLPPGQTVRLGGLVQSGSVQHATADSQPTTRFAVTDGHGTIQVTYTGILPDLFREGQGVVAVGSIGPDHIFHAQEVLAKHDERYMPPEVVSALKKSGRWQPGA
jgi:cytochrome c-type biogenesis protein CcmE